VGGEKILRHINDVQELNETIKYLHEHVRSVLNVIQGRTDSLLDFRQQLSPKVEGFKLVVLFDDLRPAERRDQRQTHRPAQSRPQPPAAAPPPRGVTRVWEERSLGTSSSPQATAFRMMRPVPAQARAAVAASISKSVMEVT